jgi:hypothetical protein
MSTSVTGAAHQSRKRLWMALSATFLVATAGLVVGLTPDSHPNRGTYTLPQTLANKPWWRRDYKETVVSLDSMHCMGGPWNQCD